MAILDAMCFPQGLVVGEFVDEVIIVDEIVLLPDHELINFPIHIAEEAIINQSQIIV